MTMKLWKVVLRGVGKYRESYVVAENSVVAYSIVRTFLNDNDLGFEHERELDNITLLAENVQYPDCETNLYIQSVGGITQKVSED